MNAEYTPPTGSDLSSPNNQPAKQKTASRKLLEDLCITGFGLVTSWAVAWIAWKIEAATGTAIYSWMLYFIMPAGAIICGLVAAIGYWAGALLFNQKPSRLLLVNIVIVSLTTYFSIHHFHYTKDTINGVTVDELMSFSDYIVAVTENMGYSSMGSGADIEPIALGKWGWGIAALQVAGFAIGGFLVYGFLNRIPYCDNCGKYLSEKSTAMRRGKDVAIMREQYERLTQLYGDGEYQAAIQEHKQHGDGKKYGFKSISSIELRKCPCCSLRRIVFKLTEKNGNNFEVIGCCEAFTHEPLTLKSGKVS